MSIQYNNLKLFRKQNGFTQEDIAEKLNVSRQAVAKWESGDTMPDIENCIALADIYGTTVDMLVRNLTDLSNSDEKKHIFGFSKMNDKGQITLPKKCREVFGLEPGDAILVLGDEDKGMALVKLGGMIETAPKGTGGKHNESGAGKRSDKKIQGKDSGKRA